MKERNICTHSLSPTHTFSLSLSSSLVRTLTNCKDHTRVKSIHKQIHTHTHKHIYSYHARTIRRWQYTCLAIHLSFRTRVTLIRRPLDMGWLRLVGSLKLYASFAQEPYKRDYILQKTPIISRSLLIVATP